jgi:vacuolar-type H+-ATPase subunit I/STV1
LCIAGAIALVVGLFYILNIFKNRKKSKRKEYIRRLKSVDFKDSKKAAYEISKYARKVANTKESKEILEQLLKRLEKYKYVKNPPEFDEESKRYLKLFLEVCCG